jgi:hypothetical protein
MISQNAVPFSSHSEMAHIKSKLFFPYSINTRGEMRLCNAIYGTLYHVNAVEKTIKEQ